MPAIVVNNIAGGAPIALTVINCPPGTTLRLSMPNFLLNTYNGACFSSAVSSMTFNGPP